MWRRGTKAAEPTVELSTEDETGGKGRPTPSRREAEAERKERLKATARGENKAKGRSSASSTTREARHQARQRVLAGDEKALSARDRGPERRYARDLVDSRHTIGEYFLYLAIGVLVIGLIPATAVVSQVLLLGIVLALVIDSVRIHRRTSAALKAKFPTSDLSGVARYAVMRGMVTRRMRVPKPQVKRGWKP
jgi:hypothetical protein